MENFKDNSNRTDLFDTAVSETGENSPVETIQISLSDACFMKGGKVNEVEFFDELTVQYPLKYYNNTFYGLNGVVKEDELRRLITQAIKHRIKCNLAATVERLIRSLKEQCNSPAIVPEEDEIHVLNGVLKTDGTFIADDGICVNRINVVYNPNMQNYCTPTVLMQYLSGMLDDDDIITLQEYLGYCLIPSNKGQCMLIITGNGGEGKSRLGIVLKEIFQDSMLFGCTHNIGGTRFFRANLKNKLLMIDDDLQGEALKNTGTLKTIITAETAIDTEEKGKQSCQTIIYARILGFSNDFLRAACDKSDGFFRRLILLTTKPVPPDRTNDPYIAEKLISEKNEIFCWMFEGLQRLIANNFKFTISEKTKRNLESVIDESNNTVKFLQDSSFVELGSSYEESSANLYSAYKCWCAINLLEALSQNAFTRQLKSNSAKLGIEYTTHIKQGKGEVRGFRGIHAINKLYYCY